MRAVRGKGLVLLLLVIAAWSQECVGNPDAHVSHGGSTWMPENQMVVVLFFKNNSPFSLSPVGSFERLSAE